MGKPSAVYFHRNRGEWFFSVRFQILDWAKFWQLPLSAPQRFRLVSFVLSPKLFGPFSGKTFVTLKQEDHQVRHLTELRKWGICFYRSERNFSLHENGTGITLNGFEFFWPLLGRGIPFETQRGVVSESTVSGTYQMPLMGIPCHCEVTMSRDIGQIQVSENWISGKFILDSESMSRLKRRFEEEPEPKK
jgi:hypothetical protein